MSNYRRVPDGKDPVLWEMAQKRASFKSHLLAYLIVNAFLWALWAFTDFKHTSKGDWENFPWPVWTTLGWGIGLAFHFAGAYVFPKANSVETEYEKLKRKQQ